MTRRILTIVAVVFAVSLAAAHVGHAQTFTVDKFDIKGDGGTDYIAVEAATGHVFVSRATHMMVIDGATGKVLGDIQNTPGVHGAGIVTKAGHGFATNGGNSTVTMFDLKPSPCSNRSKSSLVGWTASCTMSPTTRSS